MGGIAADVNVNVRADTAGIHENSALSVGVNCFKCMMVQEEALKG